MTPTSRWSRCGFRSTSRLIRSDFVIANHGAKKPPGASSRRYRPPNDLSAVPIVINVLVAREPVAAAMAPARSVPHSASRRRESPRKPSRISSDQGREPGAIYPAPGSAGGLTFALRWEGWCPPIRLAKTARNAESLRPSSSHRPPPNFSVVKRHRRTNAVRKRRCQAPGWGAGFLRKRAA